MKGLHPYTIAINSQLREDDFPKGLYVVILHAKRIPPHIGMITDDKYHSLSIKGKEINHSMQALVKNIRIRKIPSLFIKIKKHDTFSDDYLKEQFILNVSEYAKVEIGVATCLSPVKRFFEENYNIPSAGVNYIFELLPQLESKMLIENVRSAFIDEKLLQLPLYDLEQINMGIKEAGKVASGIKLNHKAEIHP
ncbi:MAG: hypothetical protein K0Q95_728 [Bacteroidota bacterium]|nr:hypothetical protein [Bacteroidota bacterium]